MLIQKNEFPFKWIPKILSVLEDKDFCTTSQVAKAIGSCVSDAGEVLRMMKFLTYFGKINANSENKWRLKYAPEDINSPRKDFRFKYIQNLIEVIEILKEGPKSTHEIANKISQELDYVREILSFLSLITEKGFVCLRGEGYPREWTLRSWPSSLPQ